MPISQKRTKKKTKKKKYIWKSSEGFLIRENVNKPKNKIKKEKGKKETKRMAGPPTFQLIQDSPRIARPDFRTKKTHSASPVKRSCAAILICSGGRSLRGVI
jgi:hypothetical protein